MASIISATQANLLRARSGFQLTINSPATVAFAGGENARLKPLKPLHRKTIAQEALVPVVTSVCLLVMHTGGGCSPNRRSLRPLSFLREPVSITAGKGEPRDANTDLVVIRS